MATVGWMSTTMKALRAHTRGSYDQLVYEDAPVPVPGPGEVLVRVAAVGITFTELTWDETWARLEKDGTPAVPGHEVSGTVAALGADVSGFAVGDAVFGQVPFESQGGAAQYVAVPATALAHRPDGVSDVDAVTLPVAALTAWEAFEDHAPIGPGTDVLVHAGAGSVGGFAIQLAVLKGANVTTTAYARDEEVVRALGATTVVTTDPAQFGGGRTYDVVLDTLGGRVLDDSYAVVREGGHLVTLNTPPDQDRAAAGGYSATFFVVAGNGSALEQIAALVASGDLRTTIAATFPLERGREGYTFAGTPGHGPGKTVLVV